VTILYRIHTEDRPNLPSLAGEFFPGFTLLRGTGYWQGQPERAAVIELYGTTADRIEVQEMARVIATVNQQQSVIVAEFGPNGIGTTEVGPLVGVEVPTVAEVIPFVRRAA
jgi:hypothetical protein